MPRLGHIIADRATVHVPLGNESMTVIYRPKKITPAFQEHIARAEGSTAVRDALYGPVASLVAEWDLTHDDGTPIDPSSVEALREVPSVVLFAVVKAVMEDMQAGPLLGGASNNGSSPRASSEPRLIGTAS